MSLTVGKAPFGQQPDGSFDFEAPTYVVYVERFPRRVRGIRDGKTVIDSDAVVLVHKTRSPAASVGQSRPGRTGG